MTEATIETTVETPVVRRAPVTDDQIIAALEDAKGTKTAAQVAQMLNMNPGSFNQRLIVLRKLYIEMNQKHGTTFTFPKLLDGRTGSHGGGKGAKARTALQKMFERAKTEAAAAAPEAE